ncbi:MAG: hypothetical protein V1872_08500 [bacterium]
MKKSEKYLGIVTIALMMAWGMNSLIFNNDQKVPTISNLATENNDSPKNDVPQFQLEEKDSEKKITELERKILKESDDDKTSIIDTSSIIKDIYNPFKEFIHKKKEPSQTHVVKNIISEVAPPNLSLKGIYKNIKKKKTLAVINDLLICEGDNIDGFIIKRILGNTVIVTKDNQDYNLVLFNYSP